MSSRHYEPDRDDNILPEPVPMSEEQAKAPPTPQEMACKRAVLERVCLFRDRRQKEPVKTLLTRVYTIEIELTNIKPRIWRKLRVPATLNLREVKLRNIDCSLGWCQDMHAYIFVDPNQPEDVGEGHLIGYGPTKGPFTPDMALARPLGITLAEAGDVLLGDLLHEVGQEMMYVYDFAGHFRHRITLKEIDDKDDFGLIGGECACPPEDGGGNFEYAKMLDILENRRHPKFAEVLKMTSEAPNYRGATGHHRFSPSYFSMKTTSRVVTAMLQPQTSVWIGRKKPVPVTKDEPPPCACAVCARIRAEAQSGDAPEAATPAASAVATPAAAAAAAPTNSIASAAGPLAPTAAAIVAAAAADSCAVAAAAAEAAALSTEAPITTPAERRNANKAAGKKQAKEKRGLRCCAYCFDLECPNNKGAFKKCSRCGEVFYCTRDCQKTHWKEGHKTTCKK